jgi:hypothetical protein
MQDILLDSNNDAVIDDFNLSLVDGVDYIAQKIKTSLLLFRGEWFADTNVGVDYYGSILIKNYDANLVEILIKTPVLEIEGVNEFTNYDMNLTERNLSVDFTVQTIYGEVNINEVII